MKKTVKEWREEKGITAADMAQKLDISPKLYQKWEEDPGKISIEKGMEIALFMNVPFDNVIFSQG